MSEKNVEVNVVCTFAGQSMNANGTTSVSFGARYDELVNVMQLCQLMSNDITIIATVPGSDPVNLATYFRLQEIKISGDGSSVMKFKGSTSFADNDMISGLPNKQSDVQQFKVRFSSVVELEENTAWEDGGSEDDWDDADWDEEEKVGCLALSTRRLLHVLSLHTGIW